MNFEVSSVELKMKHMRELTESEAAECGLQREGRYYTYHENDIIEYAEALPNGNCPMGKQYFKTMPSDEFYLCNTDLLEQVVK